MRMSRLWRSGDFHRKTVFLVDSIIDLCVNVQEITGVWLLKDVAL